jgi:DNA repair exonuclease SbcCD nuclease subunit
MSIGRLSHNNWPEGKNLSKEDHVIICGDFGLIFYPRFGDQNKLIREQYWLKWLEEKPWTTVVVLGNHEAYPRIYSEFPLITYKGAKAYKVSDSIYIIKHGEVATIENKKFFFMGGATSVDKQYRTEGKTWWPEEEPSYEDWNNAYDNLEKNHFIVDYVFTHTCPDWIIRDHYKINTRIDPVAKHLTLLEKDLVYDEWHYGHMHDDDVCYERFYCHYENIERLL